MGLKPREVPAELIQGFYIISGAGHKLPFNYGRIAATSGWRTSQAQMSGKLVEKAKRDAEQQIAKSHGEAEPLRMQREQVPPALIELRKVYAQLKAIEKWNGVLPGYVGAGVPFISIEKNKLFLQFGPAGDQGFNFEQGGVQFLVAFGQLLGIGGDGGVFKG